MRLPDPFLIRASGWTALEEVAVQIHLARLQVAQAKMAAEGPSALDLHQQCMHRLKNVTDPKPRPSVSPPQISGKLDWKSQSTADQTLQYWVHLRLS